MADGAVSDPQTLVVARRLRAVCQTLEIAVFAVVVASVLALASVRPSAYLPLGVACIGIGLLLALRAALVRKLQVILGHWRLSFKLPGLGVSRSEGGTSTWSFDLTEPALPRGPLFLPGLVFLIWVAFQAVPLPAGLVPRFRTGEVLVSWPSLTLSLSDTLRGLGFVAGALILHLGAAAVFVSWESRARFRRVLAALGTVVAFAAFIQVASGSPLIYGLFRPLDAPDLVSYGPFVNRNHLAGYLLMVIPMSLALLAEAYRGYRWRVGDNAGTRRRLTTLTTPEGTALLYATVPVIATISGLIFSTSRGALLAFVISLAFTSLSLRKGEAPAWLLALGFLAMALSFFGLERLETRFGSSRNDAPGRTLVWKDSLERMEGMWLTGTGFNTFGSAMGQVKLWTMPEGASPLNSSVAKAVAAGERFGVRVPPDIAGNQWYREAHNDYVQVLVETGIPGLMMALWAVGAILRAARHDPWLMAALLGVLLHSFVDFDLQIPAVAVLFVVLAGMRRPRADRPGGYNRGGGP